jgi:hypothetical protein
VSAIVHCARDGRPPATTHNGRLPNPLALGRLLTGQIGRWRGPYVVRGGKNDRGDRNIFWVEHHTD